MSVLRWLLIIELLGVASWPLCFLLFRRLPDGGLGLARLIGMLLLSYLTWLFASVGLFPCDTASLLAFLILYVVAAALIYRGNRGEINDFLAERKRILIFEQILFLAIFFLVVFIQSYKPEIMATEAEKLPDMMFFKAVLRSRTMPPEDLWFAGMPVNYYYLGYLVFAGLTRLASVRPEVGFNLAVASIVPLSCLGAFSLVFNITRRRGYALLAPLFLFGVGNFDAFLRAVRNGGIGGINWWYEMFAHGSRYVIPGTIHEFPCFSFLLGDLHPHYMFIPFCFLILTMIFCLFVRHRDFFAGLFQRQWTLFGILFALFLGSVAMLNIWDYPNYLFLSFLALFTVAYRYGSGRSRWWVFGWLLVIVVLSVVLFLPFYLHFSAAAKPVPRLANEGARLSIVSFVETSKRSPLGSFLIVNGLACFVIFSYLAVELTRASGGGVRRFRGWKLIAASAAAFVVGTVATGCAVVGLTAVASLWALAGIFSGDKPPERLFVLVVVFMCAAIFLGCEIVYFKDFYGANIQRMNTVFKFYFQAWILASIIFAAGTMYVMERLRGAMKMIWGAVLALFIAASIIYPVWGTYHRCKRFQTGPVPYIPTLDGTAYLKYSHPWDYGALQWVRENIPDGEVILESPGGPYSFHGGVAAFAGCPTVLGWMNHESLWRDWSWAITTARERDVKRIYDAPNKRSVRTLLDKYRVRYVYVGPLEKKKYNLAGLRAFAREFPIVYSNREVRIYRVPPIINVF